MSRVAVVFPPLRVARDFIDYPYFADLGAVQAAALLRSQGHDVVVVDSLARPGAALAPLDGNYVRLGQSIEDVASDVGECDLVLCAYTPFHRPPARDPLLGELLSAIRRERPETPIVLADLYQTGQHVVDAPSAEIAKSYPEIDLLVRYEGEEVLCDLVEHAIVTGRAEEPRIEIGPEVKHIDELPLPAWDLVDLHAYWKFHESVMGHLGRPDWAFPIDRHSLPVLTSRGCPFRCAHCSSNAGRRAGQPKIQRRHGAEYLRRQLAQVKDIGAGRVHLLDELANVNERHFDTLLDTLDNLDLRFEIPNGVRADYVRDLHLDRMKTRLTTLSVSAESGVQRVVDEVVGKDLDLDAIWTTAERAQRAGVRLLVHFMIGLPGETKAEINGTLLMAAKLREKYEAEPSVQFATPLPGTRLAEMSKNEGKVLPIVPDWGPLFQGAPSISTGDFTLEDLRRFKAAFDERIRALDSTETAILNVTYKCNNRCSFCTTGTRDQDDIALEDQLAALERARARGAATLELDGGEPTLAHQLFTLIGAAQRLGFEEVSLTTNGRMASYEEYARRLAGSGLSRIFVSLHGHDADTHTKIVDEPDAFDQTIRGIEHLVRFAPAGVTIGVKTTVTRDNCDHLAEIARLVHGLGASRLDLLMLEPAGPGTAELDPGQARASAAVQRAIDEWSRTLTIRVRHGVHCRFEGYESFLERDHLAMARLRGYANTGDEVDPLGYWRENRQHTEVCSPCPRRIACSGFANLGDPPDPGWLRASLRPASTLKKGHRPSPSDRSV